MILGLCASPPNVTAKACGWVKYCPSRHHHRPSCDAAMKQSSKNNLWQREAPDPLSWTERGRNIKHSNSRRLHALPWCVRLHEAKSKNDNPHPNVTLLSYCGSTGTPLFGGSGGNSQQITTHTHRLDLKSEISTSILPSSHLKRFQQVLIFPNQSASF